MVGAVTPTFLLQWSVHGFALIAALIATGV